MDASLGERERPWTRRGVDDVQARLSGSNRAEDVPRAVVVEKDDKERQSQNMLQVECITDAQRIGEPFEEDKREKTKQSKRVGGGLATVEARSRTGLSTTATATRKD